MASGKKTADAGPEPVLIRSKTALALAITEIDELLGRARRSKAESERLDQLSDAVRAYERKHMPVRPRSASERLRNLIELHETTTQQLAAATGVKWSILEDVLKGSGTFGGEDAQLLAEHFTLDAAAFLT